MSSLALYRRYRPETFAEVIGQQHVTDPLQQALRNNRVNHAYLFSGPRGCGKTTSARILARCLNCEQGPTPSPCGECQSCRDLARNGPGSIDVIEIDAASHGGVDDARELREKAFFGPASSRYKIYIVDEAHMVTPAGFNALLKVVEEPPEHLKFIFATTEPEKVIGTIRSRTHHYPFRLVPPGTLRDYLDEVCGREQISVEDAVLPLAVRAGAGSVRDSMSVMDQLLAGAGEDGVTYAMATSLLGYTDSALLDDVVDAFAAGDGARAFEIVDRVIEGGHDPRRFVTDLLERLRDLVILAAVPDAVEKTLIDAPGDVVERMQAQASVFGAAELSRAADIVNTGLTEMRGATSPRLQLELICARVLLPATYGDERSVQARLDRLERGAAAAALSAPGAGAGAGAGGPGAPAPGAGAPGAGGGPGAGAPGAGGPGAASGAAPGYAASGAGASGVGAAAPAAGAGAVEGHPDAVPAGPPATGAPGPSGGADGAGPAEQPPAEPARRPGAWPGGTGPGGGGGAPGGGGTGEPARRPGAWPGTAGPSSGGSAASAPTDSAPAASAPTPAAPDRTGPPASAPTGPAGSAPAGGPAPGGGDAAQIRQMWPQILEAVKNRRRFTWILLSQNAQIVGFDGKTLQVGFPNAGARDSFANGGSDEVLRQALGDALGVQWQVEAIVDPSGGGGGAGGPSGPGSGYGAGSGTTGGGAAGTRSAMAAPAPAPAPPQQWSAAPSAPGAAASGPAASASSAPGGTGQHATASAAESGAVPSQASAPAPEAPRAASAPSGYVPEEDMPAEDDPDLDESALSGHDLIVRELGATVLEELRHD
ncbi:DNA polymerase III subunit gamma and tau [Streptomyces qinglanensis]|uniref:DNA polymerase III subunit gamma and tau n=1 Tax=Streptomyces qinglanensis TaxID=943816 RepID=UPI0009447FB9|nr:DNA polymerase III subunit gamma and tau [Streptomyces qinglanensis]